MSMTQIHRGIAIACAAALAGCGGSGAGSLPAATPAPSATPQTGTPAPDTSGQATDQQLESIQSQIDQVNGDASAASSAMASPEGDPSQ